MKTTRLPSWLKRRIPAGSTYRNTDNLLESLRLQTICSNANCPNRGQCWDRGTATVLILGNVCTRKCGFCSVGTGKPAAPDASEPARLAMLAEQLDLKYLVITSVNRDDLDDGGAGHFADCINAVRAGRSFMEFEILVPDFAGCQDKALDKLENALPFVFAHNVEMVPALYRLARPGGNYRLSLELLDKAKKRFAAVQTKSSIMLGLGETDAEVQSTLADLRQVDTDRLTIGQYLRPDKNSLEVKEYIEPEKFDFWAQKAKDMGFSWVISAPFARSSYFAEQKQ